MLSQDLLFKALADTTRQRLLRLLLARELSVSELVEILEQPQSTVSRHLKVLRESGLVVDRRLGKTVYYATPPPSPGSGAGPLVRRNGDLLAGPAGSLRDQLLDWMRSTAMDSRLVQRLDRVLQRRTRDEVGFFDGLGERWDQLRVEAFGESFHFEALAALLPADWVVADIGTGTGYLLPTLGRHFRRVIAVDSSERMLVVAQNRSDIDDLDNIVFRRGSLSALPLDDQEVDLAIASLVLHHVEEPLAALREIRRCLRPGGWLLVIEQEPHQNLAFHERMADRWWGFSPTTLTAWAEQAGFSAPRHRLLHTSGGSARGGGPAPPLFVLTARADDRMGRSVPPLAKPEGTGGDPPASGDAWRGEGF